MNIVSKTSSNLIDPNDPTPLDADNIAERKFGSKMVLVVEQMQCITIWLVKACLLIMYYRLTYDTLPEQSALWMLILPQDEFEAELRRQGSLWIRCRYLRDHGDPLPRGLVQAYPAILGCSPGQQ